MSRMWILARALLPAIVAPVEFGTRTFGRDVAQVDCGTRTFAGYVVHVDFGTRTFADYVAPVDVLRALFLRG